MQPRSRRSLLRASVAAVSVGIAGCTSKQRRPDEITDTLSDDHSTATETPSSEGAKAKPHRLEVLSRSDEPVEARLVLIALSEDNVVYNQAHTFEYGDSVWLGDYFEPGEDYRFELTIEGEELFNREIYSHESYTIEISGTKTVRIISQEER